MVLDTVHKEMRYLDSLNPSERDICVVAHIQKFIKHEGQRFCVTATENWPCIVGSDILNFPRQTNGSDCGVLICLHALYEMLKLPYNYTQSQMASARAWIALTFSKNKKMPQKHLVTTTDDSDYTCANDNDVEIVEEHTSALKDTDTYSRSHEIHTAIQTDSKEEEESQSENKLYIKLSRGTVCSCVDVRILLSEYCCRKEI
ncbi:uncharacterized protein LOC134185370 [Corticium candelabrum]|uniref:uncharacterized protein LOC134185370 n=1 Tax=Corticium candelabrum TaxID=121492 RepID=UPI002E26F974|nr:uncharacterized protein LOC134185370 [Corticium candelabrum]